MQRQTLVALSACEKEYIAMREACNEMLWLLRVATLVLKSEVKMKCLRVVSGSQSDIKMSNTEEIHNRNKHINMSYHFVCDLIAQNIVLLEYKLTIETVADFFTKALGRVAFQRHCVRCEKLSRSKLTPFQN